MHVVRLIHPLPVVNPEYDVKTHHRHIQERVPYRVPHTMVLPIGTIVEDIDAFKLVRLGVAEPVGVNTTEMARMSEEKIADAYNAQTQMMRNIGLDMEYHQHRHPTLKVRKWARSQA